MLGAPVTVEEVNEAFAAAAARPPLGRVLDYTDDPIVSSDIVGQPGLVHLRRRAHHGAAASTTRPTLVKVQGWYDNEWGYANRLVDLAGHRRRGRDAGGRRRDAAENRGRDCPCSRTSPTSTAAGSWSGPTSTSR